MRRRDLLAGAAGLAVVGGGAAYALGDVSVADQTDGEAFEQFALPGIDAPGSEAGTVTVPETDRVSFVELFATTCSVCERMMPDLKAASEAVDDDVQFISVTNEPVSHTVGVDGVAEWWEDHNGSWQVAHDDDLDLTRAVNANATPYTLVFDQTNRLVYADAGHKTSDEILELIEDARS